MASLAPQAAMIGLDANILVRYFTQDDPVQAALATEVIEQRLSADEPGFISTVAMAETVWVLASSLPLWPRAISRPRWRAILRTEVLIVEDENGGIHSRWLPCGKRRGEFADALIGALCAKAGCSRVYSALIEEPPAFRALCIPSE